MKFPFKKIAANLWRPIIPISVRHPLTRKTIRYFELIGLDIDAGKKSTVSGVVAGQSRPYYLHDVEIEVGGWWKKTTVGFMAELSKNGHGFVGRDGFFDRFSFVKFSAAESNESSSARICAAGRCCWDSGATRKFATAISHINRLAREGLCPKGV